MEHLDAAGISSAEVGQILDAVAAVATPVRLAFTWRPLLRDPDDDMVLETAVNAQAEAIVTFNRRDIWPRIEPFGVAAWSPGEAIGQLEARR